MYFDFYPKDGRESLRKYSGCTALVSNTPKFKYKEEALGTRYVEYGKSIFNPDELFDMDQMLEQSILHVDSCFQEELNESGEHACVRGKMKICPTNEDHTYYRVYDLETNLHVWNIDVSLETSLNCLEPLHRRELDKIVSDVYENIDSIAFQVNGHPLEISVFDRNKVSFLGPLEYLSEESLADWLKLERLIRDSGKEGLVMKFTREGISENGKSLLLVEALNYNNFVTFEQPVEVDLSNEEIAALENRWLDVTMVGHHKDGGIVNVFEEYGSKMVESDRRFEGLYAEWTDLEWDRKHKPFCDFIFKTIGKNTINYMLGLGYGEYIGYEYSPPPPGDEYAPPAIRKCQLPPDPIVGGAPVFDYERMRENDEYLQEEFLQAQREAEESLLTEEIYAEIDEQFDRDVYEQEMRAIDEEGFYELNDYLGDFDVDPI